MSEYAFSHRLTGERVRLGLMSESRASVHGGHLGDLGVRPGWRGPEVAAGTLPPWGRSPAIRRGAPGR